MRVRFLLIALIPLFAISVGSQTAKTTKLNLRKALVTEYPCAIYQRPIQFLTDHELVLLSGPTSDCYRAVRQLKLVVVSLDGRVVSSREWPSTDQGLVISSGRLAVAASDQLLVLDDQLATVQSISLPKHRGDPRLSLKEGGLSITTDGGSLLCGGTPVKCEKKVFAQQPEGKGVSIYSFNDGRKLLIDGESLKEASGEVPSKQIADLSWVIPKCENYEYCQAYDAATRYQVVLGEKPRILIMSNGSKYPISDAAGLFPYFRVAVFDLNTRSEIIVKRIPSGQGSEARRLAPTAICWQFSTASMRSIFTI
jgi:hypothetical protein